MKPDRLLPQFRLKLSMTLMAGVVVAVTGATPASALDCTFLNPVLPQGQDPSVVYQDGYYYLVQSNGTLTITRSETMTGLGRAEPVTVFEPPRGQPYSYDVWAPELHYIDGHWYIYVAATEAPGNNPTHRMYVLQADTDDPLGSWTVRGKVYDPEADKWAIDGTVFEHNDQLYMVWSGWPGDTGDFPQNLYIAEMSDPLTLSGPRHLISEPDQPWEHSVAAINEGPQTFIHNGVVSIVYSADASWMPAYKLGMLVLTGDDPLDRNSWTKVGPVFEQFTDTATPVYGPGHNSNPVPSPDGTEYWFFYHTKSLASPGWDDRRIFAQRFTWSEDNTPVFGQPIPAEVAQTVPSGEPCGETAAFDMVDIREGEFVETGSPLVPTKGSFSVAAQVRLTDTENQSAFVSQDGGITSNFVLGLQDGRFVFSMFDGLGRFSSTAQSAFSPEADVWYELVGVHDAAAQQIALYVNGELQATAEFTTPWEALGSTIFGASRRQSRRVDLFTGELRDIRLYVGALSAEDVSALAAEPPT